MLSRSLEIAPHDSRFCATVKQPLRRNRPVTFIPVAIVLGVKLLLQCTLIKCRLSPETILDFATPGFT